MGLKSTRLPCGSRDPTGRTRRVNTDIMHKLRSLSRPENPDEYMVSAPVHRIRPEISVFRAWLGRTGSPQCGDGSVAFNADGPGRSRPWWRLQRHPHPGPRRGRGGGTGPAAFARARCCRPWPGDDHGARARGPAQFRRCPRAADFPRNRWPGPNAAPPLYGRRAGEQNHEGKLISMPTAGAHRQRNACADLDETGCPPAPRGTPIGANPFAAPRFSRSNGPSSPSLGKQRRADYAIVRVHYSQPTALREPPCTSHRTLPARRGLIQQ